ncbi:PLP-dependent aminotransferase family protein [Dyella halodurans]|uniref:PLP-dependent aminotransferase family protein n=1 Tax=Dyella halodurans TaxID=1920171 RepID=A0ABV9C6J7_9GAMM|nr:PLP-dependent aminotransferase family protein [Dyella halodurans]
MQRLAASFLPPVALNAAGGAPIYQQLSEWFRRAIIDGHLRPGQRVPSTRALASELQVSRIPVLSAYEQLLAEGYLETFPGAGTCVARSIPDDAAPAAGAKPRKASSAPGVKKAATRSVSRRAAQMRAPAQTWLSNMGAFRVGLPALDHFPSEAWSRLVNRHSRHMPLEAMAYGDPMGLLPFRQAIAEYLGTVRAVQCDASQIVVTTGSQHSLQICAHVLLDAGDAVWVEEPGYPGARQALQSAGAQLVPVSVDDEGIRVAEGKRLAPLARAAYITPSHQFPLGTTMSATRRMQLLGWAAQNDAWIIEDDYDSEYRFGGRPTMSLQGLDTEARVIYLGTFSKVMFPALRLGYMVVPKDLAAAFHAGRDAMDTFSSTLYQLAMTDFIREGHFARHIRRMRMLYTQRRSAVLEAIHQHLGDKLEVIGAEAGMQLAALLPPEVNDVAVSRKAAELGVSVRPLSLCYLKPPARGGLILGYGGATAEEIHDGIRKLKLCL